MTMELLRIENLCKTYGKGENEVKALDNVSFTVPKGQMAAVVGPSGSGKSTLLHILGGVDRPTSGKVYLDGQDVFAQNAKNLAIFRRRQVGLIYQFYNLIPVLNAEENITLPVIMDGRKPDAEQLERLLEMLGIKERRLHLPSQLSGGQQQRLCIARALAVEPEVLLMDEPTSALDPISTAKIEDLAAELKNKYTIVMVTHNMQQAARISDKTAFFLLGEVIEYADTEKLFSFPQDKRTEDYITGRFG